VTPAGRLVVCGSIIAGVAILPAQAAKLVEALLEWQDQQDQIETDATKAGSSIKSGAMLKNRSKMKYRSYSGRADGRGPSGVNIETPLIEQEQGQPQTQVLLSQGSGEISKTCWSCGESSHRTNARFCWSCGNEL
jgi:hypothetical protein